MSPQGGLPYDHREFGAVFREWRKDLPLSITEFAAKIGHSVSTIHRWDRGDCDMRGSDLLRMEHLKPGLVAQLAPLFALDAGDAPALEADAVEPPRKLRRRTAA